MQTRLRMLARAGALLVAVMLISLLLAVAVVRLPVVQRWVGAEVSARLPAGVQLEGAALTVFPPEVRLTNVSLGADAPTLASVSCRLRLAALLAGRLEAETVVVDGATLVIQRGADGTLQLAGPLATFLAARSSAASPASPTVLESLPAVTVHHGTVTFVDQVGHAAAQTLRFTGISLTLENVASGSVPFTLAGQLEPSGQISAHGSVRQVVAADGRGADQAIELALSASQLDADTVLSYLAAIVPGGGTAEARGSLDASLTLSGSRGAGLSGDATLSQPAGAVVWDEVHLAAPFEMAFHVDLSPGAIALSAGRLSIAELAAARFVASELSAEFAYSDRVVHLGSTHASAYGGSWTQQGTVTVADPPVYALNLRADAVDCQALVTAMTGERPDYGCERLTAETRVNGQWTGPDSVVGGATGSGRIELHGGTIPSSSIMGAVWHAVVPLVAAGREQHSIGAPTRVDRLTESFELRAGRMHTSDLSLVTDDYTVTGRGSIGLGGALHLDTQIALTAAGVAKLLVMAALPIPTALPTLPPIPTTITGTIGSPDIRPNVESLPLTATRSLFAGARGAGQLLEEGAGRGLRGLQRDLRTIW